MWTVFLGIFFLIAPSAVLWLCRRVSWLGKVGPVLILYVIGIIVGNLFHPVGMEKMQNILSSAMVPLSIPLMLSGCVFQRSQTLGQVMALITGLVCVLAAVVIGFFLFGNNIPDADKVAGLLTAVYTGGTINMASLKEMLDVDAETFILLNSYDMVICFLYLAFLLSIGIRLFRKVLPNKSCTVTGEDETAIDNALEQISRNPYHGLLSKTGLKDAGFLLSVDTVIIGISAGLGMLAGDSWFMPVLILALTTLGILASFWKPVRRCRYGYDIGMYFIYIFSIVVASMADLSSFDVSSGLNMLAYLSFVIFASLFFQLILSRIFRLDADTTIISSVAFICSPPFVPMMAAAMRNRSVLVSGLAIGVVGYALGNYLGFLIAGIL